MSDFKKSYKERLQHRSEEATTVRRIVAIVLAVLAVLLIIGIISGYFYIKSSLQPVDPDDESQINVEVPIGSSTSQIASILKDNDVIKNELIFRFYTKFKNETGFQAGDYSFTASMTLDEIIESLKTGKIVKEPVVRVTIPEGRNLEQIAQIYAEEFEFSEEEFLETANDEEYVNELIEEHSTLLTDEVLDDDIRYPLEGYLYATTYDYFVEDPSIEQIIDEMVSRTEATVSERSEAIEERDMSVHEIITMASLVENEAPNEDSRKEIAGVFYNRLEEDMMLQTDPTVLYALGEHKDRVLYEDLEVDSPYNTYQVEGIPAGPISSFNVNSLDAVLEPTDSDYLYFLANDDGEIFYSETLDEHNELREEHINSDSDEEPLPEDEPE
ncbi:endolytic transglycosylase MltG [Halobacillus sp. Marseille-P3879]|uniref:endolytic transglycosylase MltG n=1 Tax=Halobacillus sp. Marseille-P3879 TaxID=2045014 RepID=UPI000C7E0CCC|nr:endolytic transglycosylase MltG [Halobacillus sp. Marseille-P3879]